MRSSKCFRHLVAAVLAGVLMEAGAAELSVKVSPANDALRRNIVNFIGELGDRSVAELQRYRRIAREQAEEAAQALGYYQARIDTRVQGGKEPRLIVEVASGDPVRLREVSVRVVGPAAADPAFSRPAEQLEPGAVLDHGAYEAVKRRLLNLASRYGYFDARFEQQRLTVDPRLGTADVDLVFASGPRYRFGDVRFLGDLELDESLLRRMLPFRRGAYYDSSLIASLNRSLEASGYFSTVRVDVNPDRARDATIPIDVQLDMREPRTLGVGLGYSTDVGPRVRFEWVRHWANRRGHSYGLETEIAQPRQNIAFWYNIPLDPPLTDQLRLVGGYQYEELADNDSMSRLLNVGPEWHTRLDSGWERVLSLKWQHEEYRLGDDNGISTLLMPGVAYNLLRTDNRVDPNRGYRLELAVAGAKGGVLSDADLIHGQASAEGLVTLWQRHRFLGRVAVGGNLSSQYKEVPPSLRFFAGGDRSVRGYDYQTLSPTNSDGDHIGGRYQFTSSAEYQYSLTEKWRLAAFADQGNAFNSLASPSLMSSLGVGVRWVSPVGPIRLDLAHPLDGDGGIRLHFSVGPEL